MVPHKSQESFAMVGSPEGGGGGRTMCSSMNSSFKSSYEKYVQPHDPIIQETDVKLNLHAFGQFFRLQTCPSGSMAD